MSMLAVSEKRSEPIRILVFDCWLPGFQYVRHLADTPGVSITFIHNSKRQLGLPAQEYKDFKESLSPPDWVKDFTEYGHRFETMFDVEKPDVILVLSMHYLECRSALLFATDKGVFRAFIPHGIFLLDRNAISASPTSLLGKLKRLVQKFPRALYYARLFWSAHYQIAPEQRCNLWKSLSCCKNMLFSYSDWQWTPPKVVQSYYSEILDLAIVHDKGVVDYFKSNLGSIVERTEFVVSGTLDSGKILAALSAERASTIHASEDTPFAYYISSPYPEDFTTKGAMILGELMRKLQMVLRHVGCDRLIYRPHPGEPNWFVVQVCESKAIEVDWSRDMTGVIHSSLVCGTSSSLLYNAISISKPVVTVSSQRFKMDSPYYEPLKSYPRIALDLDLDLDTLINKNGVALREAFEGRVAVSNPMISDPISVLLNRFDARKGVSNIVRAVTKCS